MEDDPGMVANCDMATFDTEPRPLMHRVSWGHGDTGRGQHRARGSSDLFWSSGWRINKGEDWGEMSESEATEITNKARSGEARVTRWPSHITSGFNGKNAVETFAHKMQFKRAAQLYTTVVTHYNIRIWPAWSRWTREKSTKYHPGPLKIQIVEFCLFVKMSSISISLDHLSQNGAKFNSLSIEICV